MKKQLVRVLVVVALVAGVTGTSGCQTGAAQRHAGAAQYGGVGGLLGGVAGAVIGNNIPGRNSTEGAIAGATLGAILGATLGNQRDQAEARQAETDAKIGAVSEVASTVIVNVHNSNGSMTPVVIRKVGNQYVGPKGEYYTTLPTEAQLKIPYGF
jgi:hypothetical protein